VNNFHSIDAQRMLLLDAAPICCKLWNRDHQVIMCNQECVRAFGAIDKQDFCERFFSFSPEYQPDGSKSKIAAANALDKAFDEGYVCFQWMHRKADGTLMPAEITMVRVVYGHDFVIAAYIRDMTNQKEMEDQLKNAIEDANNANAAKSAFLAKMSHEMRSPLNVIIGLTDLHMEESDAVPQELSSDIRKINTAGSTLLGIVNDVLDLSKIESGRLTLNPAAYCTASLLNDIITLNQIRIESKPIKFIVNIDENLPYELYGDDLRLSQVFNNLLSNAFKYTKEGQVRLSVDSVVDGSDVWLTITVADTGIGIKAENLQKIYDEYMQVDVNANRKIEGTGLGLSIARSLIQKMDGDINIVSEYGKGTTFTVRVKQQCYSAAPIGRETVSRLSSFTFSDKKQHISSKIVRVDLSYARVLVVDDLETNLDVASGMMKKYKLNVDCVLSGRDAINLVKKGTPVYDAIFMDHMMPEMDGVEATKRIRDIGSDYAQNVPIISLTANAIIGNEQFFLNCGFQAFLSKPIDMLKLDSVLKQWVRNKDKELSALKTMHAQLSSEKKYNVTHIDIEGIDDQKALSLYDQDQDILLSVIGSYLRNTPNIIKTLSEVDQTHMHVYMTAVHGLKSASEYIGATQIRTLAARLESLAKEGNLDAIQQENGTLISDVNQLLLNIQQWFEVHQHTSDTAEQSLNKSLLKILSDCCLQYNMHGVDGILAELKVGSDHYNQSDCDFLNLINDQIITSDFDETYQCIQKYLEGSS